MLFVIIVFGIALIGLERLKPARPLPRVKGWWMRVVWVNLFQCGILVLGSLTWERWFQSFRVLDWSAVPAFISGAVCYFVITFIFYWWHRARHASNFLWRWCHQLHHSPQRIETVTSFYKHPLEIVANGLLIASINHLLLGASLEAAAWAWLYSALAEYFYHMNLRTPYWVGFFFQRPEMHRIHHQKGVHRSNYGDFPLWDMLFGTFHNPKEEVDCGFEPHQEQRFGAMLLGRDVEDVCA